MKLQKWGKNRKESMKSVDKEERGMTFWCIFLQRLTYRSNPTWMKPLLVNLLDCQQGQLSIDLVWETRANGG